MRCFCFNCCKKAVVVDNKMCFFLLRLHPNDCSVNINALHLWYVSKEPSFMLKQTASVRLHVFTRAKLQSKAEVQKHPWKLNFLIGVKAPLNVSAQACWFRMAETRGARVSAPSGHQYCNCTDECGTC